METGEPKQSEAAQTRQDNPAGAVRGEGAGSAATDRAELPSVRTGLSDGEIVQRLTAATRQGRLPGLRADGQALITVVDFGHPFESVLEGRAEVPQTGGDARERLLRFEVRLQRRLPAVFAAMLVFTVWPGVWLTDSMLKTYFSWYTIQTWWWYLPLTAPFLPFAFVGAVRKSRASARLRARELVERIATELNGRLDGVAAAERAAG